MNVPGDSPTSMLRVHVHPDAACNASVIDGVAKGLEENSYRLSVVVGLIHEVPRVQRHLILAHAIQSPGIQATQVFESSAARSDCRKVGMSLPGSMRRRCARQTHAYFPAIAT